MGTRIHTSWRKLALQQHAGNITFKPIDPEASPLNTLLSARICISVYRLHTLVSLTSFRVIHEYR